MAVGLLAKRKTAAQIAPASQPLSVSGLYALPTVAMVLREAACSLAVSGLRLKSTHERGRTPAILGAVGSLSTSTIWFEKGDGPTWHLSLGLSYCGLRFTDWTLQFAVSGEVMAITTLNALTSNDELVNAGGHGYIRALVAEKLSEPDPRPSDAQLKASENGLAHHDGKIATASLAPHDTRLSGTTTLESDALRARLLAIPFKRLDSGEVIRWQIGLEPMSWAEARIEDVGTSRQINVDIHLEHSPNELTNAVATLQAKAFVRTVVGFVSSMDDAAAFSGAEEVSSVAYGVSLA